MYLLLVKLIPPFSWQEKHMENTHPVQVPQRTFAFAFTLCTLGWSEAYSGLHLCNLTRGEKTMSGVLSHSYSRRVCLWMCKPLAKYQTSALRCNIWSPSLQRGLSRTQGTLFNVTPQKRIKQTVSEPVASSGCVSLWSPGFSSLPFLVFGADGSKDFP